MKVQCQKEAEKNPRKTDRVWQGVKIMGDLCTGRKKKKKDDDDLERITSSCDKFESPGKRQFKVCIIFIALNYL